jgi:hypothetical protein
MGQISGNVKKERGDEVPAQILSSGAVRMRRRIGQYKEYHLLPNPKQVFEGSSSVCLPSEARKRPGLKVIGSEYTFGSWAMYHMFGTIIEFFGIKTGGLPPLRS